MKDKIVAAILALFLGTLGIHWFYLGDNRKGITYLLVTTLLCWTLIAPLIMGVIAFIDGILFLLMDENEFNAKYNNQTINYKEPQKNEDSI